MRLSIAWIIAAKDFQIFRSKRSLLYATIAFPLLVGIGLPSVILLAGERSGGIPAATVSRLLDAFSFFFIVGASILPVAIASYTIAGEKVEKSLEPLLATPTTDGEILLGKSLTSFLPPVAAIWVGSVVFMAVADRFTRGTLGYLYFPNWNAAIIFLLVAPLVALLSVQWSVLISARVNDVRAAQQLGSLIALPLGAIYVASEIGVIALDTTTLLILSGLLLAADLLLFFLSTATFRREAILTKWK